MKLTKEKELLKPEHKRFLLREIPEAVEEKLEGSATDITSALPENSNDGNWRHPDPEVASHYEYLMENILAIPLMENLFNIGADFLLFNLARIPILKYFNTALLQALYAVPRFWVPKTIETNLSKRARRINLGVFILVLIISLYFFLHNSYLAKPQIQCHLKHMRPKAAYSVVPTPSHRSARSLMMCGTGSEDDLR